MCKPFSNIHSIPVDAVFLIAKWMARHKSKYINFSIIFNIPFFLFQWFYVERAINNVIDLKNACIWLMVCGFFHDRTKSNFWLLNSSFRTIEAISPFSSSKKRFIIVVVQCTKQNFFWFYRSQQTIFQRYQLQLLVEIDASMFLSTYLMDSSDDFQVARSHFPLLN